MKSKAMKSLSEAMREKADETQTELKNSPCMD